MDIRHIEFEGIRYYYMMDLAKVLDRQAKTKTYDKWEVMVGSEQCRRATVRTNFGFNEIRLISEQGLKQLYPDME